MFSKFNIKIVFILLTRLTLTVSGMSYKERFASTAKLSFEKGLDLLMNVDLLLPSAKELGAMGKETFLGLPASYILHKLDRICSVLLRIDKDFNREKEIVPTFDNLSIIFYNDKENVSFPLEYIDELIEHPQFNRSDPIVLLVTGWLSNEKNSVNQVAEEIYRAYKCRGSTNFLLMDHDKYITSLYVWSAVNTDELGKLLAEAIADLVKHIDLKDIHVIGHSLGAQIVGATGRHFYRKTKKNLPRITGLDPARPCFNEGEALTNIGRGDADFVDIIHTNSGGLGKGESIGDADFYPNGIKVYMPGCLTLQCSHAMAWRYYAESVYPGNENGFPATRCSSLTSYLKDLCLDDPIPMGYATPSRARGNYFLITNSEAPYGDNSLEKNKCINLS